MILIRSHVLLIIPLVAFWKQSSTLDRVFPYLRSKISLIREAGAYILPYFDRKIDTIC